MAKKGKKIIDHKKEPDILQTDAVRVAAEYQIRKKLEEPLIRFRYQYAIDVVLARLRLINAELTEQNGRQIIRSMFNRIKTADSILKKLIKKERETDFETAAATLNDIAGVRAVCFFSDDIYPVAEAIKCQKDFNLIKEKDYVKNPKKSGYQSVHLIIGVPVTYNEETEEIRVEIQLRSFAMDYWAELDNQMCYKKSAGEIEQVEREIRNYSDVIAKVDSKMLELRKRIEKMN